MVAVAGGTLPTGSLLAGAEVTAFEIAKYEVTWGEWQEVSDWGGAEGRTYDLDSTTSGASASHPVENVSWYDAVKWCNAKSEMEGLTCPHESRQFLS
jgi:formylglycine-generating enzyme required for sulfatase activity